MRRTFAVLLLLGTACASRPETVLTREVDGQKLSIRVTGFESAKVEPPSGAPQPVSEEFDCIVVGGGLSGMTAAWYLRDRKVVVLERKDVAGGLSFHGRTKEGIVYTRGAAYYARPEKHSLRIYNDLGLTPLEETAIPDPTDSYWYKGKLYLHMWEEPALHELPPGFAKFKEQLEKDAEAGRIAIQPLDEAPDLSLDRITAAEYLKPFGPEVKAFMDSYCQSALGSVTDDVSALAFCNFYISEIETRHAWPGGTGGAGEILAQKLDRHDPKILRRGCTVTNVRNTGTGVEVTWHTNGRNYSARAKYAILATPLNVTSWIVEEYPKDRKALVDKLKFADYVVHSVFTSRELFTQSFDTWFSDKSFTDLIVGRWNETKGFKKARKEGPGILAMYWPLAPGRKPERMSPDLVADMAAKGVLELRDMIPDLAGERHLEIESYRWPSSIHVVPPGFFTEWVKVLKPPFGRIHFAGSNLGTPSLEEALYRGWCAAEEVRKLLSWVPLRRAAELAA